MCGAFIYAVLVTCTFWNKGDTLSRLREVSVVLTVWVGVRIAKSVQHLRSPSLIGVHKSRQGKQVVGQCRVAMLGNVGL